MLRNADQVGGGVPHRIVLDRPIEPDHHEQPADDAVEAAVTEAVKALNAEEITELCLRHTLYDWAAQAGLKPLPVVGAQGVYFHTADGRRFIDFNSQLMCVNAGHGDRRIIEAIQRQAEQLPYISPFMAHESRARLGAKLASLLPGDIDKVFFTLAGADANENAIKIARTVTGRPKILARYRSYHGSTGSAVQATGDPRRWPNEHSTGVIHVLDPYHGIERGWDDAQPALRQLEETIRLEGPETIAGFLLEPISGTNGVLIPPDGSLQAYEEDDMVGNAKRMGTVLARQHQRLMERHPCVGAVRSIGLFGAIELVRSRKTMEPLAPFNGTSPEMKAIVQALLDAGLFTFVRWNTIMTNPPLCINEAELDEGFEMLETAREIGDRASV